MLADIYALLPLGLLVIVASFGCEWAARQGWLPYWLSRKALHILAVGACAWAPLWVDSLWSLIAVVAPAWMLLLWLVSQRKLMVDDEGRRAWGIVWFPLAYLILLITSGEGKSPVVFGMAVLAVCDPAATVAGTLLAKKYYTLTGDKKSWIGGSAFLLSFLVLCGLSLYTWTLLELHPFYWLYFPIMGVVLAVVESLGSDGRDNLYVPLVAAALWNRLIACGPFISIAETYFTAGLALVFVWLMYKRGSLTPNGAVGSWLLAVGIIWFGHWTFLVPILVFFISSVLVGKLFPSNLPSDVKSGGGRDISQVFANGGVYLLVIYLISPNAPGAYLSVGSSQSMVYTPLFDYQVIKLNQLSDFWLNICTSAGRGIRCCEWTALSAENPGFSLAPYFSGMLFIPLAVLATANSDTWASEIGRYFKGRTYDILRFRRVEPGLSGGISLAGTIAAGFGAALIAAFAFLISRDWISGLIVYSFIWIFGFAGMLIDSILGALFQPKYKHPETGKQYDYPWWAASATTAQSSIPETNEADQRTGTADLATATGLDYAASNGSNLNQKNILRKLWMSNDMVNFASQLIVAALLILLLGN
ncbi:MAG: DUF92 domain-containing protein [Bacteroidota bacterium]